MNLFDPGLDEEEDDELLDGPAPADSIAGPQTPRDQVMQRISQVRGGSSDGSESGAPDDASVEFARNSAMTAGLGRGLNALAAGTGFKPDNSGYDAMEKQGQQAMTNSGKVRQAIEARMAKQATQSSAEEWKQRNFEQRERGIQAAAGRADEKIAQKLEDRDLQLAVPGFERTGEVLPKLEEAQKFRKAVASAEQLKSKLGRLRDLVESHGSYEFGGEGGQEMSALATEIQLLSKNEDMYQLGVLTGPDLGLLRKITGDPESFSSMFTRDKTRLKQIDTQAKSLDDRLAATSKSMGYRPKAPVGKPKQVTQNGVTYTLNEATGEYE